MLWFRDEDGEGRGIPSLAAEHTIRSESTRSSLFVVDAVVSAAAAGCQAVEFCGARCYSRGYTWRRGLSHAMEVVGTLEQSTADYVCFFFQHIRSIYMSNEVGRTTPVPR